MNPFAICLCLSLSFGGNPPPRDAWVAEDKWKHMFAAFAVTGLAGGTARLVLDADRSVVAGAAVGAGLSVWKELRDARTPGATASAKDLVWDAVGVGAAAALLAQAR